MEDYNLLAVFNLGSDSDSSYGDTIILPITQSEEVIAEQDIYDSVRWPECVFRIGDRFSARRGGGPGQGSLWREPETSSPQTSQQSVVSEVQGAQALLVTETFDEPKPQSLSPVQRADLEWDDWQPGNEPFTPDNFHTKQLAKR